MSGYWLWFTKDATGTKHPGVFVLQQKGIRVFGYNVIEAPLSNNERGLKSSLRIIPAVGEISIADKGERALTMTLIDFTDTGTAVSTARISPTGKSLSGETKQEIVSGAGEDAQSVSTEYEWSAVKFAAKQKP